MDGNREYKSDVFSMLMQEPKNALSLYNALNGTDYSNPDDVEMVTLERGISLTVRNDAAFLLDSNLSIYEHQSTVCPNMPIRCLVYFTTTVQRLIKGRDVYGHTLIKIPTPHIVVFYNGKANQPEQYEMKLSDAFEQSTDAPEVELTCRVYNINNGNNAELLEKCTFLREYMIFVDYCRYYLEEFGEHEFDDAIDAAIDKCIEESVLVDFLRKNREAVKKVEQLDYTFERRMELAEKAAREYGMAQGAEQAMLANIHSVMKNLNKSADEAMDILGISSEERENYRTKI